MFEEVDEDTMFRAQQLPVVQSDGIQMRIWQIASAANITSVGHSLCQTSDGSTQIYGDELHIYEKPNSRNSRVYPHRVF